MLFRFVMIILTVNYSISSAKDVHRKNKVLVDLINKYSNALGLPILPQDADIDRPAERRMDGTLEDLGAAWDSEYIKRDNEPPVLPDGFPGRKFEGPGKLPTRAIQKREGFKECGDDEWFVFVEDRSACVQPQWESAYDPTFCTRMRNKWVYCGCDEVKTIPGMKDGIDTCVDKDQIQKEGRCSIKPCREPFRCVESVPGTRYDCVDGEITIPTWYNNNN